MITSISLFSSKKTDIAGNNSHPASPATPPTAIELAAARHDQLKSSPPLSASSRVFQREG